MTKEKLTKLEKYWILYDVANSAFILLVATIVPIYFNSLAEAAGISEVDYLAYWGYAASVATLVVALIGPVFGTMADMKNFKKPIFTIDGWRTRLCGVVLSHFLGGLFGGVCHCQGGLFYQPDFL